MSRARGPRITLPETVGLALDDVTARDRAYFEANPDLRWRIRASEPVEHESHDLVAIATTTAFSPHRPFVLVLRAPECVGIRLRYYMSREQTAMAAFAPELACPFLSAGVAAATDGEFFLAVRPYLRSIGGGS